MLSYELCKALKDAGYPLIETPYDQFPVVYMDGRKPIAEIGNGRVIFEIEGKTYIMPILEEIIEEVKSRCNEFSLGWNDAGCFWHFQYGNRGAGYMMEGIGTKYGAFDCDSLIEAVANLYLQFPKKKE